MAMTRRLWSINAAATELGRDRRTIAAALREVPPDGQIDAKTAGWWLETILQAMQPGGADGKIDKETELARKAKEEADKLAMQNAHMRGELLPRADVDAAVAAAFARVRARLINLPAKLAPVIVTMESPAEAQAAIRDAIYEALRELSETSVSDLGGDDGEVVEPSGPAAGPDDEPVG